jgi:hypothetical protein
MTTRAFNYEQPSATPHTFRLPKQGEHDPHFGITRSYYYFGEAQGWWKLKRLIGKGKNKGITLVPYAQVAAHLQAHGVMSSQNSAQARAAKATQTMKQKH